MLAFSTEQSPVTKHVWMLEGSNYDFESRCKSKYPVCVIPGNNQTKALDSSILGLQERGSGSETIFTTVWIKPISSSDWNAVPGKMLKTHMVACITLCILPYNRIGTNIWKRFLWKETTCFPKEESVISILLASTDLLGSWLKSGQVTDFFPLIIYISKCKKSQQMITCIYHFDENS